MQQSADCEFLVNIHSGQVIGHIHRRNGRWDGYWLKLSARLAVEGEYEMKKLLDA